MLHQPIIAEKPAWRVEAERLVKESNRYPMHSPDWVSLRRAAFELHLWETDAAPRDYDAILAAREAQGPLFTRAEMTAMEGRA